MNAPARAADPEPPDMTGYWQTPDEGALRFQQDGKDFYALLNGLQARCPLGRGGSEAERTADRTRNWYIAGYVEGSTISGTMLRCTNARLVQECGHAGTYKVPFTGTVRISSFWSEKRISVTLDYNMEYWKIPDCSKEEREEPEKEFFFAWVGLEPNKKNDEWRDAWRKFKDRAQDKFWQQKEEPLF